MRPSPLSAQTSLTFTLYRVPADLRELLQVLIAVLTEGEDVSH